MTAVLFVGAAAVGAVLRAQAGVSLPRPVGTLVVNLAGAFAIGLVHSWTGGDHTIVAVGGLGALTTFSTLAAELVELARERPSLAGLYLAVTLGGGIGAAGLGLYLA